MSTPLKFESYGLSDIGCVRQNNEDVFAKQHPFFILADGMGGHRAGEVAAQLTVQSLCSSAAVFSEQKEDLGKKVFLLAKAIAEANQLIYQLSCEKEEYKGMGTTLCCLLFSFPQLIYAHVGDSRIYRFRQARLTRLTEDHSLRHELISRGALKEESSASFPYKNVITRAIGTSPDVEPAIHTDLLLPKDIYFLCSDGLTDHLSDKEIENIFLSSASLKNCAELLVNQAKEKGGNDNITVVIIRFIE